MKKSRIRFVAFPAKGAVACMLGFACTASAQIAVRDTFGMAEVVVPRTAREAASSVPFQRVDTLDFRRRGITDIGDAVRRLAGVNLRDYGGAGGLKTVSVRGLGAGHTAVCYDGLPMAESRTGQFDLGTFSTDRLASLTLTTVDAPQLLCPVRTLGAATLRLEPLSADTAVARRLDAALRVASFETVAPSLAAHFRRGSTTFGGAAHFLYATNNYPFILRNGHLTERKRREGNRMQQAGGELSLRHRFPRAGTLSLRTWYADTHRRLPGMVIYYAEPANERLHEQQGFSSLRWEMQRGAFSYMAAAKHTFLGSRYADVDAQYPGGVLRQNYRQHETYGTAGLQWHGGAWRLAYALDATRHTLRSNLAAMNRVRRIAVQQALSAEYAPGNFRATARLLRHDFADRIAPQEERSEHRFTPSLALAYAWRPAARTTLRLRTFYHELFRMPSFSEAYYYHLGEQHLRPERTRQLGAGLTLEMHRPIPPMPLLTITADVYRSRVSDRLMSIPYNLFVWRTMNLGKVLQRGLDLTLGAQMEPLRHHLLSLSASYTLQEASDRTVPGGVAYGRQTAYTPRHSGAASLAYEVRKTGIALHATFASERWSTAEHTPGTRLPGYAEAGVAVYTAFRLRSTHCTLRGDIINAIDKSYEVIRRYPMPGRSFRLTMAVRL